MNRQYPSFLCAVGFLAITWLPNNSIADSAAELFDGGTSVPSESNQDKYKKLAAEYQGLKTERGKLVYLLSLVDRGVLRRGTKLEEVKSIFGKDLTMLAKDSLYVVYADGPLPDGPPSIAVAHSGWYLLISVVGGQIDQYSLSNLHKPIVEFQPANGDGR